MQNEQSYFIRPGTVDDAEALVSVCADIEGMYGYGCPVMAGVEWWRNKIRRLEGNGLLMVAQSDEVVIGFVEIFVDVMDWSRRHVGALGLCVRQGFRKKGVGRTLLENAISSADLLLGLARIELFVWSDQTFTVALYESVGFRHEGTHPAFGFRAGAHATAISMARVKLPPL